jgi:hypothetical protein
VFAEEYKLSVRLIVMKVKICLINFVYQKSQETHLNFGRYSPFFLTAATKKKNQTGQKKSQLLKKMMTITTL